jgi:hypothetical protein
MLNVWFPRPVGTQQPDGFVRPHFEETPSTAPVPPKTLRRSSTESTGDLPVAFIRFVPYSWLIGIVDRSIHRMRARGMRRRFPGECMGK